MKRVIWEAALAVGIVLALVASQGCGGSEKFVAQAGKTVATAYQATNATAEAFLAWDRAHQQQIVASSASQEEATAKLTTYRAKRHQVEEAFVVAYNTLAAAASAIALVELGSKPDREPALLLAEAIRAVLALKATIDAVRELDGPPPVPLPPAPHAPAPAPAPEGVSP